MSDTHTTYNPDILEDLGWMCQQYNAFMLIKASAQNKILITCLLMQFKKK